MTEKYTGQAQDRRYAGGQIDVTYSLKRCIHAAECVTRLSAVFDNKRRPWIAPDGASAAEVARVVEVCPSGALHHTRKDGGPAEPTPAQNTIRLWRNGPLQFTGNLTIHGAKVEITEETRATLCRCGASHNKPFCDNSHRDAHFTADDSAPVLSVEPATAGGVLQITATENGPIQVLGLCNMYNAAGELIYTGDETWLCRCGGSQTKPFCDGTHNTNGFTAE